MAVTSASAYKLASWNVNGIRAATLKGFGEWLAAEQPSIACLQEVKADRSIVQGLHFPGYTAHWNCAEKAGYSGTALLIREGATVGRVYEGLGMPEFDVEGRVIAVETPEFTLINIYAPHSQRELGRLDYKLAFSNAVNSYLDTQRARGKPLIVAGDLNVAHHPVDLANASGNKKNAGFLPAERAWLDGWVQLGMVDAFRHFTPDSGHYTWWSQRVGVREKNVGWRIDMFWVDKDLVPVLQSCVHQPQQRGSDHCPVVLELVF